MDGEIHTRSVEFFDAQFQRQIREREYALNPFETLALDYLKGSVLDLGSGLGNLSLEAGRRGHHVVAVDASPAAKPGTKFGTKFEFAQSWCFQLPIAATSVRLRGLVQDVLSPLWSNPDYFMTIS